jgi:UDP-glucose 4-epimerase
MKENVLVTGGAGFIGSHLVRYLVNAGNYNVVVVDDLSGGRKDNLPEGIVFIKGSVTDHKLMQSIFNTYKFIYVYHLAAYAAEGLSHFIRRFNYTNNLIGSINLINESIKNDVKCFVFTSSIAVYGNNQTPMIETMVPIPEDPYGIAKYSVELDLRNAHEMFGLNYVIFRPHNVYGEYQNIGDRYRNVVGIFMNQILKNEPLSIFGDGEQMRAFSYVGDIIEPIALSPLNPKATNQVFNVGADLPMSVNTLAFEVIKAFGKDDYPINYLPPRNEVKVAFSDHSKIKSIISVNKKTDLAEGIQMMADWVKRVGSRTTKKFKNIEIERNLPKSWL